DSDCRARGPVKFPPQPGVPLRRRAAEPGWRAGSGLLADRATATRPTPATPRAALFRGDGAGRPHLSGAARFRREGHSGRGLPPRSASRVRGHGGRSQGISPSATFVGRVSAVLSVFGIVRRLPVGDDPGPALKGG
ncbi:hypothetical protein TNIN_105981, partial [Trichonephila inaurata madagascariensis]